jgi:methylphosphotriester-DNA--protein-cysteine methyltransferase
VPHLTQREIVNVTDSGFRYCRIPASSEASPYVEHLWTFYARRCRTAVEGILPDANVELYFNLGPTGRHVVGRAASQPSTSRRSAWVVGQHNEVLLLAKEIADCDVVGVRLQPGVIRRLLGVPAGELRNLSIDLDVFWGGAVEELRDQLYHTPDPLRRAALVERALTRRFAAAEAQPDIRRLSREVAQRSSAPIGVVAHELGFTHRRLISLFDEHIGMKPKEYQRVKRLRLVLERMSASDAHLARIACDAGFYDQAHLANDFRLLTGLTLSGYSATRSSVGVGSYQHAAAKRP